jgi:hypothetical protein
MAVSTSNVIGVALGYVGTSPTFNLGTTVNLDDGGQAVYVQAASTVSQYAAVSVLADGTVVPLTSTNSADCKRVGFAQVSMASLEYGWVHTGGKVSVNLAANCALMPCRFTPLPLRASLTMPRCPVGWWPVWWP